MAKLRVQVGKTWVEVDCVSVKDGIQELSQYMEVFVEGMCGVCQSTDVIPNHRTAKGYDFYEMKCLGCGATLSFGQTKEGGRLFPRRRDQEGNELGKQGWHQYQATQADGGGF